MTATALKTEPPAIELFPNLFRKGQLRALDKQRLFISAVFLNRIFAFFGCHV